MALTQQRISLFEFLKLPEEKPALEYIDGMVIQKVSPKTRHRILQGELLERINGFARPQRLAWAFAELRETFARQSLVPDVSVLRWDRVPYDDDGNVIDDITESPAIAVEIVSPDQGVNALIQRCVWYVSHGVEIALLIDPDHKSFVAFRLGQEPRVLQGPDRIDLDEVLPGFALTADELFASLHKPS
jgi:Uma2 family endonuclease